MRFAAFVWVMLTSLIAVPSLADNSVTRRVMEINDHLLAFYDGRDPSGKRYRPEWNWVDDGAMKLGIATYAIYRGDRAIIFDTFTSPRQAEWARGELEKRGVRRFTVVLSHWHPDHIGGNAIYGDSNIIASDVGRRTLAELQGKLEAGEAFGPPGIKPVVLPDVAFHGQMDLYLGDDLKLELINIDIHSPDSTVIRIPSDGILLAGDTLEDSVTFMVEIGDLPAHVANLEKMKAMSFDRIYPNHGDPAVIANGGYRKTFIDATTEYIRKMLSRAKEPGYLDSPLEDYIGNAVKRGWISLYEPYRDVHKDNLKAVHEYYKDKPLPLVP